MHVCIWLKTDYSLFLFNEINTPEKHIKVKIVNDIFITLTSVSGWTSVRTAPGIRNVTIIVTITILLVCPTVLIVFNTDVATP